MSVPLLSPDMLKSRDQVHCPLCGSCTNFNNFANHLNKRHQGARYPAEFAHHFHFDVCGCGLGYRDVYCMNEHRSKCDKYAYPPLYLSVDHHAWNGFHAIVEADCTDGRPATHSSMRYGNLREHRRRHRRTKIYTAPTIVTAPSIWNRRNASQMRTDIPVTSMHDCTISASAMCSSWHSSARMISVSSPNSLFLNSAGNTKSSS